MQVAKWDDLLRPEEFVSRLTVFNSVNGDSNVVSFHWCYFMIVERLSRAIVKAGYKMENIMQWAGVQVFKKEHRNKRGVTFRLISSLLVMGDQLRRVKYLADKELPLADSNILFAYEGATTKRHWGHPNQPRAQTLAGFRVILATIRFWLRQNLFNDGWPRRNWPGCDLSWWL